MEERDAKPLLSLQFPSVSTHAVGRYGWANPHNTDTERTSPVNIALISIWTRGKTRGDLLYFRALQEAGDDGGVIIGTSDPADSPRLVVCSGRSKSSWWREHAWLSLVQSQPTAGMVASHDDLHCWRHHHQSQEQQVTVLWNKIFLIDELKWIEKWFVY